MTDSWFSLSGIWVAMILESANLNLVRSPCTEVSCFESGMCNLPLLPLVCLNSGSEIWNVECVEPLREFASWNLQQIFPESEIWNVLCLLNCMKELWRKWNLKSVRIHIRFHAIPFLRDWFNEILLDVFWFNWIPLDGFRFNEIPFKVSNPSWHAVI